MGHIDVSVIIPVFNVEEYLPQCLESVLEQTHRNLEIICVNDGSADRSGEILEAYALRDERIKVIHTENQGLSCARNTGLAQAGGKYVYFLDSDDWIVPQAVEWMLCRAEAEELDLLRVLAETFADEEDPQLIGRSSAINKRFDSHEAWQFDGVYDGKTLMCMHMTHGGYRATVWSYFVLRALLLENQIRFYPGILYEDRCWTYEVYMKAKRAAVLYETVCLRRVRKNSITTQTKRFEHYRGMLVSHREIVRAATQNGVFQDERCRLLMKEAGRTQVNAAELYLAASEGERERVCEMADEEKMIFFSGIDRFAQEIRKYKGRIRKLEAAGESLRKENESLEAVRDSLRKEKEELEAQTKVLREAKLRSESEQQALKKENARLRIDLRKQNNRSARLKEELDRLKNSETFRIGKAIVFIPRKILCWLGIRK